MVGKPGCVGLQAGHVDAGMPLTESCLGSQTAVSMGVFQIGLAVAQGIIYTHRCEIDVSMR